MEKEDASSVRLSRSSLHPQSNLSPCQSLNQHLSSVQSSIQLPLVAHDDNPAPPALNLPIDTRPDDSAGSLNNSARKKMATLHLPLPSSARLPSSLSVTSMAISFGSPMSIAHSPLDNSINDYDNVNSGWTKRHSHIPGALLAPLKSHDISTSPNKLSSLPFTQSLENSFASNFSDSSTLDRVRTWTSIAWKIWDALILYIQLINLIAIPMVLAWTCDFAVPRWISVMYLHDLCLLLDVGLTTSRPYRDEYGTLITNPITIRRFYFSTNRGFLELLGSLPLDAIPLLMSSFTDIGPSLPPSLRLNIWRTNQRFNFAGMQGVCTLDPTANHLSHITEKLPTSFMLWAILRTLKLLTTGKFFIAMSKWHIPNIHMSYSRLLKNLMGFIWLSHVDACLFWCLCYMENSITSWINASELGIVNGIPVSLNTKWSTSIYSAQQALFFSSRTTLTDPENLFCTLEMLFGAITNGSIFGNITNLILSLDSNAALDKKAEKQSFKMEHIKSYMRMRRFTPELQMRVRQHTEFKWIRNKDMDEEKLFGELPKSLRQEICNHMYLDLVGSVPLFKDTNNAFKQSLARAMRTITVQSGFYVFRQNDDGQEMYFIRSGIVEVMLGSEDEVIAQLKPGSFFGEIAILEAGRRSTSARTCTITELCVLTKDDFSVALQNFPKVAEAIAKMHTLRKAADERRREEMTRQQEEEARNRIQLEQQAKLKKRAIEETSIYRIPSRTNGFYNANRLSTHERSNKNKEKGKNKDIGSRKSIATITSTTSHMLGSLPRRTTMNQPSVPSQDRTGSGSPSSSRGSESIPTRDIESKSLTPPLSPTNDDTNAINFLNTTDDDQQLRTSVLKLMRPRSLTVVRIPPESEQSLPKSDHRALTLGRSKKTPEVSLPASYTRSTSIYRFLSSPFASLRRSIGNNTVRDETKQSPVPENVGDAEQKI